MFAARDGVDHCADHVRRAGWIGQYREPAETDDHYRNDHIEGIHHITRPSTT